MQREEVIRCDEEEGILDCFHGKKKTLSTALLIVSFFFILIALLVPFYLEGFLQSSITSQKVVDSPDADNYENWLHSDDDDDLPVHVSYYFWNITNADEFLAGNQQPMFDQIGPYEYAFHVQKINVSFANDSKSVNWWPWAYYTYWPDPVDPSLDHANDIFWIPNHAMQGVYYFYPELTLTEDFLTICIDTNSTFFLQKSPDQIIFGYDSDFVDAVNPYLPTPVNDLLSLDPNYTSPEDLFNRTDGPYTTLTGHDDIDFVSKVVGYNGMTNLSKYWGDVDGAIIQGNTVDQVSNPVNIRQKYAIWLENLVRGINLTYTEKVEYKGIDLYRFRLDPDALKNASLVPDNAAWYQFGPSGVMNTSLPAWAPIFMSKPHFLDADPFYTSQIYNMTPDPAEHDMFVDIEPITGFLMHMEIKFQVNYYLQATWDQPNVKPVYYPLCWSSYAFGLTDKRANDFTDSVYTIRDVELGLLWGCLGLTVVTMIVCFIAYGYLKFFHLTPEKRAERSSLLLSGSRPNSRTNSATNLAGSRTNSGTKLAGSRTTSDSSVGPNQKKNSDPTLARRAESNPSVFSSSASLLQNQEEDEGL